MIINNIIMTARPGPGQLLASDQNCAATADKKGLGRSIPAGAAAFQVCPCRIMSLGSEG